MGAEQFYRTVWTFLKIWDECFLVLGELPLRYPSRLLWNIFSKLRAKLIQLAVMDIFLDFSFLFFSVFKCRNSELLLCQCQGH